MHFHSIETVAVANHPQGLLPLCQEAMFNVDTICYHVFAGILTHEDEKEKLIQDLGNKDIMILRNHGILAAGKTIAAAFLRAYYIDKACKIQVATPAQGIAPELPSDTIVQGAVKGFARRTGPQFGRKDFDALMR